ncbi:MAG: NAD-dependent epimerase/dehydratase family protein [Armatimonadetes bacterium]|nr:NAD-dependent epimerase/dehydratase family protein [Armatimonadota bacterium]
MRILILGGSGFLSGTVARAAVAAGHDVTALTRGRRELPDGVRGLTADRQDTDALRAVLSAEPEWDLVVDCIGYRPDDARQDVELFRGRAGRFAFVSTDFVHDPRRRRFPEREDATAFATEGYGGDKRRCEEVFLATDPTELPWTVFRPGHIYGPGSRLGCLPAHARDPQLVDRIRRGEKLKLVAGGHLLQQPTFAADLAALFLSAAANAACVGEIFSVGGPEVIESRRYYEILAAALDVPLSVTSLDLEEYVRLNPETAPFLCHRFYDLTKLRQAGRKARSTGMVGGLREHFRAVTDGG